MDRVRNEKMRRRTRVVRELAERAELGVLRWFGHVERMEERLVKKITRSDCEAKRKNSHGTAVQCEESVRYKRDVCGGRKSGCA